MGVPAFAGPAGANQLADRVRSVVEGRLDATLARTPWRVAARVHLDRWIAQHSWQSAGTGGEDLVVALAERVEQSVLASLVLDISASGGAVRPKLILLRDALSADLAVRVAGELKHRVPDLVAAEREEVQAVFGFVL